MLGFPTPEEAARATMGSAVTHVVDVRFGNEGESAYVVLAIEVAGTGFYLDENMCERESDGSWVGSASGGGGFTDRTLEDLHTNPPPQGLGFIRNR